MANIIGKTGTILKVDAAPSSGAGTSSPLNTLAQFGGSIYIKTGPTDIEWALTSSVPLTASIFVAKNGSDTTGDGSIVKPYLTVKKAMDTILDATNLKRYAIMVMPGRYDEIGLTLKANVFIVGMGQSYFTTRISNNTAIALDTDFVVANDCRSGFYNINVASALSLDFNAVSSNQGKLYFQSCQLTSGLTATAFSSINQVEVDDCFTFGDITLLACSSIISNTYFAGTGINYTGVTGKAGVLLAFGNSLQGNVSLIGTDGTSDLQFGNNKSDGTLSITDAILISDCASLPVLSKITLTGTGSITRLNDAYGLEYTPADATDWVAPPPTTVQDALDRMADLLKTLNLGNPIP